MGGNTGVCEGGEMKIQQLLCDFCKKPVERNVDVLLTEKEARFGIHKVIVGKSGRMRHCCADLCPECTILISELIISAAKEKK